MSVAFVHGNPDRAAVWEPLIRHLGRDDSITLELPGFGAPIPDGFAATRWDYKDWLVAELEALSEPPDLVAHDFGALIGHGVLLERPELVRSWAFGNSAHADYVLEHARTLQTTRIGEQQLDVFFSLPPEQRHHVLLAMDIPEPRSRELVANMDRRQMECALAFYRSAVWTGDWQLSPDQDYPPGLVIWGENDIFQGVSFAHELAKDGNAELVILADAGHWWQLDRPKEAAAALTRFWGKLQISEATVAQVGRWQ
jgi:pimeloyl-ACP methyl ester carboxylesterase